MGRVSSTSSSTIGGGANQPTITNTDLTADIEEVITIPAQAVRYRLQFRGCATLQIRTAAGTTEYWTVDPGNVEEVTGITPTSATTLYITSSKTGVLELFYWS